MSYDIYIGEAVIEKPDLEYSPNGEDGTALEVYVERREHAEAPLFPGDPTKRSNHRMPSYSGWERFCVKNGLHALFYGDPAPLPLGAYARERHRGLFHRHPGCAMLLPAHLELISAALARRRVKAGGRKPGWNPNADWRGNPHEDDDKYDGDLARLMWLEWWVRWALAECEIPAIYNR